MIVHSVTQDASVSQGGTFSPGQSIRVIAGALTGLTGIVVEQGGDLPLLVRIARGIYIRVEGRDVESRTIPNL